MLTVVVLLVFASIETCNAIFLNHTVTVASYEGARIAEKPTSSPAGAEQRCNEIDMHIGASRCGVRRAIASGYQMAYG